MLAWPGSWRMPRMGWRASAAPNPTWLRRSSASGTEACRVTASVSFCEEAWVLQRVCRFSGLLYEGFMRNLEDFDGGLGVLQHACRSSGPLRFFNRIAKVSWRMSCSGQVKGLMGSRLQGRRIRCGPLLDTKKTKP